MKAGVKNTMSRQAYHIDSYLKWRGDVPFSMDGINEIDNLIFCALVYYNLSGLLDEEFVSLSKVYEKMKGSVQSRVKMVGADAKVYERFLEDVVQTKRYCDVRVSDYVDVFDEEQQVQFCACTFHFGDGCTYIAFCGTDSTLIGWKEDFMLSFQRIASQDMALSYVQKIVRKYPQHTFYVGGHSKGGNLALFACAYLEDELLRKIAHIYINDGPGLCPDVFDTSRLERLQEKTTKLVPYFCVVGKLFEPEFADSRIVRSSNHAIMQHDILSWEVADGGLRECGKNAPQCIWINQMFDRWLEGIPLSEREPFVNKLFDALTAGGATTLEELSLKDKTGFEHVIRAFANSDKMWKEKSGRLRRRKVGD